MADDKNNFISLVSIIKVEPEEFQTSGVSLASSSDEILRKKAQIFSDPVVFLERVKVKNRKQQTTLRVGRMKKKPTLDDQSALKLVYKGNSGKTALEPHNCSLCGKVFGRRDALKKHLMNIHGKGIEMFCDLCPKTFRVKSCMIMHMRSHMKKAFACNICDYKTVWKQSFEIHKKRHLKQEKCKICNKQVASLRHHLRTHKKESCPICNKIIGKKHMRRHMKLFHDDKRYKCTVCSSTFPTKEALRRHKLENHYEGELHRCHCGSVFKTKSELKSHQLVHESRKIICGVCEKKFVHLHSLKRHHKLQHLKTNGPMQIEVIPKNLKALSHNGKFVCDKCGAILRNRNTFISHIRLQHSIKTRFFCDSCPKSFKKKYFLEEHMQGNHFKINPFTCEVCGHKSLTKGGLKTHMLVHEPKKECKVCHKLVANLYEHMKTHVKVDCPICAIPVSKKSLHKHSKRMHTSKK